MWLDTGGLSNLTARLCLAPPTPGGRGHIDACLHTGLAPPPYLVMRFIGF